MPWLSLKKIQVTFYQWLFPKKTKYWCSFCYSKENKHHFNCSQNPLASLGGCR
jgi:hypothetical protein